jgi:hypothetical protein
MKLFVVFVLWTLIGWDVGVWGESVTGIPSVVGNLVGIAVGAGLAIMVRRRLVIRDHHVQSAPGSVVLSEAHGSLDRAA